MRATATDAVATNADAAASGAFRDREPCDVTPTSVCAVHAAQSSGLCAKCRLTPNASTCDGALFPAFESAIGASDDTANCDAATRAAVSKRSFDRVRRDGRDTAFIPRRYLRGSGIAKRPT
jgi:hypothetical protein